jgi:hypothetical protein
VRKLAIAAAAFVISAALGVGLVVVGAMLILLPRVWGVAHDHASGIGAIAGGINGTTVLLVPLACGALGAFLAVRREDGRGH